MNVYRVERLTKALLAELNQFTEDDLNHWYNPSRQRLKHVGSDMMQCAQILGNMLNSSLDMTPIAEIRSLDGCLASAVMMQAFLNQYLSSEKLMSRQLPDTYFKLTSIVQAMSKSLVVQSNKQTDTGDISNTLQSMLDSLKEDLLAEIEVKLHTKEMSEEPVNLEPTSKTSTESEPAKLAQTKAIQPTSKTESSKSSVDSQPKSPPRITRPTPGYEPGPTLEELGLEEFAPPDYVPSKPLEPEVQSESIDESEKPERVVFERPQKSSKSRDTKNGGRKTYNPGVALHRYAQGFEEGAKKKLDPDIPYFNRCCQLLSAWCRQRFFDQDEEFRYNMKEFPNWVRAIILSYGRAIEEDRVDDFEEDMYDWLDQLPIQPLPYAIPKQIHSICRTPKKQIITKTGCLLWEIFWDNVFSEIFLDLGAVDNPYLMKLRDVQDLIKELDTTGELKYYTYLGNPDTLEDTKLVGGGCST